MGDATQVLTVGSLLTASGRRLRLAKAIHLEPGEEWRAVGDTDIVVRCGFAGCGGRGLIEMPRVESNSPVTASGECFKCGGLIEVTSTIRVVVDSVSIAAAA